jgi:hypothetical protein
MTLFFILVQKSTAQVHSEQIQSQGLRLLVLGPKNEKVRAFDLHPIVRHFYLKFSTDNHARLYPSS